MQCSMPRSARSHATPSIKPYPIHPFPPPSAPLPPTSSDAGAHQVGLLPHCRLREPWNDEEGLPRPLHVPRRRDGVLEGHAHLGQGVHGRERVAFVSLLALCVYVLFFFIFWSSSYLAGSFCLSSHINGDFFQSFYSYMAGSLVCVCVFFSL